MSKNAVNFRGAILRGTVLVAVSLAALSPAKYVSSIYGYFPFLMLIFLVLLSGLHLLLVRRQIRFMVDAVDLVCQRGDTAAIPLWITNRQILPCPKISVCLYVSDPFGAQDMVSDRTFSLPGKSSAEFPLRLKMEHIGAYTAGVRTLRIHDMLGIFSVSLPVQADFAVTVLPGTHFPEDLILEKKPLTESQNAQLSTVSDGFDYTGVREYAFGDSMKRIHWKLSAHASSYMTKISEACKKSDLTVMLDFVTDGQNRKLLPVLNDCLVESALSLCEQAIRNNVDCALLFAGRDGEPKQMMMQGKDYEDLIRRMPVLCTDDNAETPDGADMLVQESRIGSGYHLIVCTTRITDRLVQELIAAKQRQRSPMLCAIVPPDGSGPDRNQCSALLDLLDDCGVPYRIISAEAAG